MKDIPLGRGVVAFVNDDDYMWLSQYKWHHARGKNTFYAVRTATVSGRQTTERMHRLLLPGVAQVDHIDGNGLNNQRWNLRGSNNTTNHRNQRMRVDSTTGLKGVYWYEARKMYRAYIKVDNKTIYLAWTKDKYEASRAYDEAAIKYFGEFSLTNETLLARHTSTEGL